MQKKRMAKGEDKGEEKEKYDEDDKLFNNYE